LNLSEEVELGIDSVSSASAPQHLPLTKGYAIDPSHLIFSSATLTSTANGDELYKCKDWNFSQQTCNGTWEKIKELKIGEEYSITIDKKDPAFLEISSLSMDGTLDIYREQSNRVNTGQNTDVRFVIVNTNLYIDNLTIIDTIPPHWIIQDLQENAISDNKTIKITIQNINTPIQIVNYSLTANNEGKFNFTSNYSYTINGNNTVYYNKTSSQTVIVNNTEAAFEIETSISINKNNFGRILDNETEYQINFRIKNSDAKDVKQFDTYFRWIVDESWNINLEDIGEGCLSKNIRTEEGRKIIECSWKRFRKNKERTFTITTRNPVILSDLSKINITYDPPEKIILSESRDDPEIEVKINATIFYDHLIVRFKHNSSDIETITIDGNVNYTIDKRLSKNEETATLTVFNYNKEYFTLNIGDKEIIPFGKETKFFEFPAIEDEKEGIKFITGQSVAPIKEISSKIKGMTKKVITKIISKISNAFIDIKLGLTGKAVSIPITSKEKAPVISLENDSKILTAEIKEKPTVNKKDKISEEKPAPKPPKKQETILQKTKIDPKKSSGGGGKSSPTENVIAAPKKSKEKFRKVWITTQKNLFLKVDSINLPFNSTTKLDRTLSCYSCGKDSVPADTEIKIVIEGFNFKTITSGTLEEYYPVSWQLIDTGNGSFSYYNSTHNKITWNINNSIKNIQKNYSIKTPAKNASLTKYYLSSKISSDDNSVYKEDIVNIAPFEIKIKDANEKEVEYDFEEIKIIEETSGKIKLDASFTFTDKKIKKIKFNNLTLNKDESFNLSIEDAPIEDDAPVGIEWENVYSIDPTKANFSKATVTSIAKGSALYKCEQWNFSTQTCFGNWKKIQDLIPGQEYNFTLTALDPGYAEAGLASINTNKSIYHPNETAKIIMVVLDTKGFLISNADVKLNVTTPNNTITFLCKTCHFG